MKYWNLEQIILWDHDKSQRTIKLKPGKVNIITGDSNTGKSAISEIFDFVMGSSKCHIPDRIRNACSWFGLLWVQQQTRFLVCRKSPDPNKTKSEDFFFLVGEKINIPPTSSDLHTITNRDGAVRKFEQIIGLGDVQSETFDSGTRPRARISARNLIPYLILDDDVIISKTTLFRGANDQRRQSIIDTLPYFLGITDEETVAKENRLARLRRALAEAERRYARVQNLKNEEVSRSLNLLAEASQVGLYDGTIPSADEVSIAEVSEALRSVAEWTTEKSPFEGSDELDEITEKENAVISELRRIKSRISSAKFFLNQTDEYESTTNLQQLRLKAVDLIPLTDDHKCPLCQQPLSVGHDLANEVRTALRKVGAELEHVRSDRPKLGNYLLDLENQKEKVAEKLAELRKRKASLIQEEKQIQMHVDLDQRRQRIVGRVSLFLETSVEASEQIFPKEGLSALREEIASLESELDVSAKLDRLQDTSVILSQAATSILKELPFDKTYDGRPVFFDPRKLESGILGETRRIPMRDIGSDENYLSLHLAVILALHKHFGLISKPVPGFIILDQLSRPYYPADPGKPQKEIVLKKSKEVTNLQRYFDFLYRFAKENSLQFLVLEHAYFSDDKHYMAATIERWTDGKALVPDDWEIRT